MLIIGEGPGMLVNGQIAMTEYAVESPRYVRFPVPFLLSVSAYTQPQLVDPKDPSLFAFIH